LLHPEIKAATSSAAVHNEATVIRGSSLLG
jgi:hypothetical protein